MFQSPLRLALALLFSLSAASPVWAVRPFITDDAEIAGRLRLELETYGQWGLDYFEHAFVFGFGVTEWLELGLGFEQGVQGGEYGLLGPLFHIKAQLNELPDDGGAFAVVLGGAGPFGSGSLRPEGMTGFLYGAYTHSFLSGDILLHANIGISAADEHIEPAISPTAALGVQVHLGDVVYGVAEAFYADPLDPHFDLGSQVGLRFILSDQVQIDAAVGGHWAEFDRFEPWATVGLRLVTKDLDAP